MSLIWPWRVQETLFLHLHHPRARCQASREYPIAQSLLILLKLANPLPCCLALPLNFHQWWAMPLPSFLPLLAPDHPGISSMWHCMTFCFEDCEYNIFCFPKLLLCLLLWPHLTDHYIKEDRTQSTRQSRIISYFAVSALESAISPKDLGSLDQRMVFRNQQAPLVKNLPAMQETWVQFMGQESPLEKEIGTHSSILAWEIPWTEQPDWLHSIVSQKVGNN